MTIIGQPAAGTLVPTTTTDLRRTQSSSVAIGTATLFLAIVSAASFLADDRIAMGGHWMLRGALIPAAEASIAIR